MADFEKLGAFYLGKIFDPTSNTLKDDLVLYDSKDLTTHAVCVGMTGSGKTGLCISLLEEAAIDNIPALVVDPKGDITNLLLTFPNLEGKDFLPWINKSDAERKGVSPEEFADSQAQLWKNGLQQWGQDGNRIKMLRENSDFIIYTPGSTAGMPISILDSFKSPSDEIIDDGDLFGDKISATTASLLGLLGIDADPLKSKEHILLSNIIQFHWTNKKDLDLATIIQNVQTPPFTKIGVFDIESFYPEKERFELAMQLNNILSAPGFQTWLTGEPLDIDKLLYSNSGKPKTSIFYTAHLSDSERMFFTSLLLNQLIGWVRTQSGTTSLRALLYVDEIFGYLPPVSNPPTKKPFLTLLKQARAFGVGLVLATQNPVDLDYKSLSNAGTWFIGRLQTERDRMRVLDGLEGATLEGGSKFDRNEIDKLLSSLDNRIFLLHNVHEPHPVVFNTRWVMSYLRGPLTRNQIKELKNPNSSESENLNTSINLNSNKISVNPLPKEVKPIYLKREITETEISKTVYQPYLFAQADVNFLDKTKGIDYKKTSSFIVPITSDVISVKWHDGYEIKIDENILTKEAKDNISYSELPNSAKNIKNFPTWQKFFEDYLTTDYSLELFYSPNFKQTSNPLESDRDFKIRLTQITREKRDTEIGIIKDKFARKIQTLETKIRRAQEKIDREKSQSTQVKLQTAISVGSTILGALFGKKAISTSTISKAGTAMKSAGKAMKETGDINRAQEEMELLNQEMVDLQDKLQEELHILHDKFDLSIEQLETIKIRPKKANISVKLFNFIWIPIGNEILKDIQEIEFI
ncbi:MAG: DUF87 domain-containing protein [Ignavibacteriae bacterium]|nr:DUF87 domain-containing protein [Ignavibacteriota bacterium]